jgi:hypothetical protein
MKRIIKFIQMFSVKNEKKVLGRWNIDTCDKKVNSKIDLSNEDHCGPCGQYRIDKIDSSMLLDKKNITIKVDRHTNRVNP